MSYAIIQTGGKQYKVKSGEILKIEKLPDSKPDTKIEFKEILAYGDDKMIEIGSPTVTGAKVEANLVKNGKNRTVLVFKKRRRHNSRRKNGHRQEYSMIKINKIFSKDGKILSETEKKVVPVKKTNEGAKVEANLIKNDKNRTVLIFKKRRRQNSRRKNGHRQEYSMIKINKIFSKDGKILSESEKISKTSKKEVSKKEINK